MHAKSHYHLGQLLLRQYLQQKPRRYRHAFLIGCLEPDKNPVTYLKGSIRCHWFRGHHWANSQRYIHRICRRLEQKRVLRLLDYYTLGKLIHYAADAFTFSHNEAFQNSLAAHRQYEQILHEHFRHFLRKEHFAPAVIQKPIIDMIHLHHKKYSQHAGSPLLDCEYTLLVCRSIMAALVPEPVCAVIG